MAEGMQVDADITMSLSDIEIHRDELLGRGGFGEVLSANHGTHGHVAVKLLINNGVIPARNVRDLKKEARRLKESSNHPNIINLLGILMERDHYGLVLEYMHFGSSASFVKDYKQVETPLLMRISYQVISAMQYLHASTPPIMHLDMKADNVLIDKSFNAKICDFGLSEWKTVTCTMTRGMQADTTRRCTITHIAPEILQDINAPSTCALDVYAFGITLWEIFTAQVPYENRNDELIKQSVLSNQRPSPNAVPSTCPRMKIMIVRCWNQQPNLRPTFADLSSEIEELFKAHEKGIDKALKSIRAKICEKFAINDEEYMDTEYIDDINVDETEVKQIDPTLATPGSPMETDQPFPVPINVAVPPILPAAADDSTEALGSFKVNMRTKELEFQDKQIRKILRSPLAMEIINSGMGDTLPLYRDGKKYFEDPKLLREYINNDTELRMELMRCNSPVLANLNSPRTKEAGQRGHASQKENKLNESLNYRSYMGRRPDSELSEREKKQRKNKESLRKCAYGQKLFNGGMGPKLLKALREPYHLKESILSSTVDTGGAEMFDVLDPAVIQAAKDPMLLQILVAQDPELLDRLMRNYSEMMVKLIKENKTTYRKRSERDNSRRMHGMMGDMDLHRMRHMGMDSDSDDDEPMSRMMGMRNIARMGGGMEMRQKQDMMMRMIDDRRRREKMENDHFFKKKNMPSRSNEEQMKINRKEREKQIVREAERNREKREEEQRQKEKEHKEAEEKRKQTEIKRKEEETKRKKEEDKKPGGILNSMYGIFNRKLAKEIKIEDIDGPIRSPGSLLSMDQLSGDPFNGTSRSSASFMPPPKQPIQRSQQRSPTTQNSPVHAERQNAAPLSPRPATSGATRSPSPTSVKKEKEEKMDTDTMPKAKPKSTPTFSGGGATGSTPITISHNHAGGGFTHITMNSDMEMPPNMQVGNSNTMVVNSRNSDEDERPKKKKKHKRVKLPTSENLLTMDQIDMIATGIGKDWKKLCRELGIADAEVEQIEHDYHINGLYEMMYQGIQRWLQRNAKAATVRAMGEHLNTIDREDLIRKLK